MDADDIKKLETHIVEPLLEGFEAMGNRFDKSFQTMGSQFEKSIGALGTKIDKLVEGQERLVEGQAMLVEGQAMLVKGLTLTNDRIEQVVVNTGAHWRDLDRRVTVLETTVRKNGKR